MTEKSEKISKMSLTLIPKNIYGTFRCSVCKKNKMSFVKKLIGTRLGWIYCKSPDCKRVAIDSYNKYSISEEKLKEKFGESISIKEKNGKTIKWLLPLPAWYDIDNEDFFVTILSDDFKQRKQVSLTFLNNCESSLRRNDEFDVVMSDL